MNEYNKHHASTPAQSSENCAIVEEEKATDGTASSPLNQAVEKENEKDASPPSPSTDALESIPVGDAAEPLEDEVQFEGCAVCDVLGCKVSLTTM